MHVLHVFMLDPIAKVAGSGTSFAAGDNTTLNCAVSGIEMLHSPALQYVWRKNWMNLTKQEESSLMLGPLMTDDSGSYTCTVTIDHDLLSTPITVTSRGYNVTLSSKLMDRIGITHLRTGYSPNTQNVYFIVFLGR